MHGFLAMLVTSRDLYCTKALVIIHFDFVEMPQGLYSFDASFQSAQCHWMPLHQKRASCELVLSSLTWLPQMTSGICRTA